MRRFPAAGNFGRELRHRDSGDPPVARGEQKVVDPAVSLFDLPEEAEERLSNVVYDRVRSALACGLPVEAVCE